MFERFTKTSRDVVVRSRHTSQELGHTFVGTEHLLLALLDSPTAVGRILRDVGLTHDGVVDRIERQLRRPPVDIEADRTALASIGIDLDRVEEAVDETFGPGAFRASGFRHRGGRQRRRLRGRRDGHRCTGRTGCAGRPGSFSPRAKRSLELSLREAIRLRHKVISPEHIALGLLREGEGLAALVLAEHGLCFEALRTRLVAAIDARR